MGKLSHGFKIYIVNRAANDNVRPPLREIK